MIKTQNGTPRAQGSSRSRISTGGQYSAPQTIKPATGSLRNLQVNGQAFSVRRGDVIPFTAGMSLSAQPTGAVRSAILENGMVGGGHASKSTHDAYFLGYQNNGSGRLNSNARLEASASSESGEKVEDSRVPTAVHTAPPAAAGGPQARIHTNTVSNGRLVGFAGNTLVRRLEQAANDDGSMASSTAVGTIKTATGAVAAFRASQAVSEMTYITADAVKTGVIVFKAADRAVRYAQTKFVPYSSRLTTNVFRSEAYRLGAHTTRTGAFVSDFAKKLNNAGTKIVVVTKGTLDVATTIGRSVQTVSRSANALLGADGVPLKPAVARAVISTEAVRTGLNKTRTAQRAVTGVKKTSRYIKTLTLRKAFRDGKKAVVYSGKKAGRLALKAGKWSVKKGIPGVAKRTGSGLEMGAGFLEQGEDKTIRVTGQYISTATKGAKLGVAGVKTGSRVLKTSGKAAIKTAKGTYSTVSFIHRQGWKAFWRLARKQAKISLAQAGKTLVSGAGSLVKIAAQKMIIPLLILVGGVFAVAVVTGGPIMTLGTMFTGFFEMLNEDGTRTEQYVEEYLKGADGIPRLRAEAIGGIINLLDENRKVNGGTADYVRLQSAGSEPEFGTLSAVESKFIPEAALVEMIFPILNSIIDSKYEMQITKNQTEDLMEEIFNGLYGTTESYHTEYCGQAAANGSGEAVKPHLECGQRHSRTGCPNPVSGVHTEYTCSYCDYFTCQGHKGEPVCNMSAHQHTDSCMKLTCGITPHQHTFRCYEVTDAGIILNCGKQGHQHTNSCKTVICGIPTHEHTEWESKDSPGCYATEYHPGELSDDCGNSIMGCKGYTYCGGHTIYTIVLSINGINELLDTYFLEPIAELEAISERSIDEDMELAMLSFGYDLCKAFMEDSAVYYGGAGFMNPVRYLEITSEYGWREHPIYGDYRFHYGLDMAAEHGTPIYAAKDGVVAIAAYDDSSGYYVCIQHDEGFTTYYMHMSYYAVRSGESVKQGQVIGYVGSTGVSTGPHLHFEIRLNYESVDPEMYIDLDWMPGDEPVAEEKKSA